jgi:hypothetical protein
MKFRGILIASALIGLAPVNAGAQHVECRFDRDAIWNANKQGAVRIKVSGRDASGKPTPARTGTGIIVRSSGVIATAAQVVGQDAEWEETPSGPNRVIEVFGLDVNDIERPMGKASSRLLSGLDIAILNITANDLFEPAMAGASPAKLDSVVAILWDPESSRPAPVRGDLIPTDGGKDGEKLTILLPVTEGHSGSGVFDCDNRLVGIITNRRGGTRVLATPVQAGP